MNRNISQNGHNLKLYGYKVKTQGYGYTAIKMSGLKYWYFSCYSTLRRWMYNKCRSGLKLLKINCYFLCCFFVKVIFH